MSSTAPVDVMAAPERPVLTPRTDLVLAQPRGFCAGVVRAIAVVEQALDLFGAPVHVFHEIVHNGHVVQGLARRGAVFVDQIEQIPRGAVTVFSAHGVSRAVVAQARARGLRVIDATCPLVAKVHLQAQRYAAQGRLVLIIGHAGHDEVEGTLGAIDGPVRVIASVDEVMALELPPGQPLAYVTQTTLSVDDTRAIVTALEARFPGIPGPALADICYATQNRQTAVRLLARQVDRVLVVGARNSSNSCRLREVAEQQGVPAWLVEDAGQIEPAWLEGALAIGISAGASTPEVLVQAVCDRLRALGAGAIRMLPGRIEDVVFRMPLGLSSKAAAAQPAPIQALVAVSRAA